MRFFVDANVMIYADTMTPYREPCRSVQDAIVDGRAEGVTSVLVIEALWRLELHGTLGLAAGSAARAIRVFDTVLPMTDRTLQHAFDLEAPRSLGAADRVHAATCAAHGIGTILTADAGFDRVTGLARVDPLDAEGVGALLA